jgi:hypothetical protein
MQRGLIKDIHYEGNMFVVFNFKILHQKNKNVMNTKP